MTQADTNEQPGSEEFAQFPLRKRRFLERFAETGSVSAASKHAGVTRNVHARWKAKNRAFSAAWDTAQGIAIDLVEGECRRRAVEGTLEPVYHGGRPVGAIRKYSDLLLIFLLKAMKPEKYRDNYAGYPSEPRCDPEEIRKRLQVKLARLASRMNGAGPHPPDNLPSA